jgi:hypothetical protein
MAIPPYHHANISDPKPTVPPFKRTRLNENLPASNSKIKEVTNSSFEVLNSLENRDQKDEGPSKNEEAKRCYEQLVTANPDTSTIIGNILFTISYKYIKKPLKYNNDSYVKKLERVQKRLYAIDSSCSSLDLSKIPTAEKISARQDAILNKNLEILFKEVAKLSGFEDTPTHAGEIREKLKDPIYLEKIKKIEELPFETMVFTNRPPELKHFTGLEMNAMPGAPYYF